MQFFSTDFLAERYTTFDSEWPMSAPSSPPGFGQWLPYIREDNAIAHHDVSSLASTCTARSGQKIAGDGHSALAALTTMLPPIPMAHERAARLHKDCTSRLPCLNGMNCSSRDFYMKSVLCKAISGMIMQTYSMYNLFQKSMSDEQPDSPVPASLCDCCCRSSTDLKPLEKLY